MLSEKQIRILMLLAEHFTLTAAQIKRLIFKPDQDRDGRQTRRFLTDLYVNKLICKTHSEVVNPLHGLTCPVYYPARLGCEALAMQTGDHRWLRTPTQTPNWQNLAHWVELANLRITVQAALTLQSVATMTAWYNEFDIVGDSDDPQDRYRLYTVVATVPKKIPCIPDAAFELEIAGYRKAFYIELERGTNPIAKAAAEKTPGYAGLDQQKLHRRHFPQSMENFTILMVAPNARWRDALRVAISKKQAPQLWKLAALNDLKPETFLSAPVWYPCVGPPVPLVKGGAK